jgi:hypothetical protein
LPAIPIQVQPHERFWLVTSYQYGNGIFMRREDSIAKPELIDLALAQLIAQLIDPNQAATGESRCQLLI